MKNWSSKKLARAALIAALYTAVTMLLAPFAFGPLQIRPAEALCILPLFFPETIPGLYVGCLLANLLSAYGVYDVLLGSLATLLAAFCTYFVGRAIRNDWLRVLVGGLFPVLFNAILVPLIWILAGSEIAYWYEVAIMLLNESVWIYLLGIPLYFFLKRMRQKEVKLFC